MLKQILVTPQRTVEDELVEVNDDDNNNDNKT